MNVDVTSHLDDVLRATEQAMKKAARMVGGTVEGHAKEACPVDTGLLRNSITFAFGGEAPQVIDYQSDDKNKEGERIEPIKGKYEGTAPQDEKGQITVYVGTNVEYAPYQELGAPNANIEPRPFLRPAFENFRYEIEQILEKCFTELP